MALLWNNGAITTTSGVPYLTLSGHTTSATNSITIRAAPGESFVDTLVATSADALAFNAANGVGFTLPTTGVGNTNYFVIQDNYVYLQGLQFQDPNSGSGSTIIQPGQNCTIQNCVLDGYGQSFGAAMVYGSLAGASTCVFNFLNNLVVDRANTGTGITIETNYNSVFANNSFILTTANATHGGIVNTTAASGVTVKVINNIMIGYAAAYAMNAAGIGTITESYGAYSAASLTGSGVTVGSGNLYSQTLAGVFVSSSNFKLNATSPAINAGFTDTTDIPAAVDIIGTARPQGLAWDIGAFEYMVPGAIGTVNGQASVAGVSGVAANAAGTVNGKASVAGVSGAPGSVGTINGHASVSGMSSGASVGTINGQASVIGYVATGAITATVAINPIGTQALGVAFPASGTYTLTPQLQFSDDSNPAFTPIPSSGISALGSTNFSFIHPAPVSTGTHNLLVEDTSTDSIAAQNYTVLGTSPPPPPPPSTGGIDGVPAFQVGNLTALASIIPAYVYQQYADDDNIQAFFAAYNASAQAYLDWFNAINLPVYTGPLIVGALLDWVAEGLYGISRPTLSITTQTGTFGDFDTFTLNSLVFNGSGATSTAQVYTVTDDIFKRILTWSLYKGDGKQFNVMWLKRRVARFLAGTNGTDYTGTTDQISVTFTGTTNVNITITNGVIPLTYATIFQVAVTDGVLPLPFQYVFTVLINTAVTVSSATIPSLSFNTLTNSQYLPIVTGF